MRCIALYVVAADGVVNATQPDNNDDDATAVNTTTRVDAEAFDCRRLREVSIIDGEFMLSKLWEIMGDLRSTSKYQSACLRFDLATSS